MERMDIEKENKDNGDDKGVKNAGAKKEKNQIEPAAGTAQIKEWFGHGRRYSVTGLEKKRKAPHTMAGGEDAGGAYKKKESSEVFIIKEAMEAVTKLVTELQKHNEQNTKREIKDITTKLARQVETFNRQSIKTWLERNKYEKIEKMTIDMDTQTMSNRKESATQTTGDKVIRTLTQTEVYEKWKEMSGEEWDEGIFTNTEVRTGNPLKAPDKIVKVIITEPDDVQMNMGIQRTFRERYPELPQIVDDCGFIEQKYTVGSGGCVEEGRRKIIKIRHDGLEKSLFRKLLILKTELGKDKEVAVHAINKIELETYRKMVEAIFHSTDIKVFIYSNAPKDKLGEERKERKSYALVVDKGERSFKDSVINIRKALGDEDIRKSIKSIRSTKDGKVLITTDKDQDVIEKAQEAIRAMPGERMEVRKVGDDTETLYIRGMDISTEKEEIKEAIERTLEETNIDIQTSELRPMRNNTQAITVTISKRKAETLLKKGPLKIGLTRCRVERKVNVDRCFRCWDYNHTAKECKGPDRSKCCFKCGKGEHDYKTCKENEACPLCKVEGHKAGTGRCKAFMAAISLVRKADRKVNG